METILYSQFRSLQVDQIYNQGGLALNEEAKLDLHGEQFAWDAELLSIEVDDLNLSDPVIAVISLTEKSNSGSSVSISYSNRKYEFQLSAEDKDKNGSLHFVKLGETQVATAEALKNAIDQEEIGLQRIWMVPTSRSFQREKTSSPKPSFTIQGEGLAISDTIDDKLFAYHAENKEESIFEEPARTFATALSLQAPR